MQIVAIRKSSPGFSSFDYRAMFRLRHVMFRERLGWDVRSEDGLEFDEFDQLDPLYLVARDGPQLYGCWRILPSTGPNMLRDVFPALLAGQDAPCGEDIWELSRFAVFRQTTAGFGLTELPMKMMLFAVRLAQAHGVRKLVTVISPAMQRMLRHAGLQFSLLGPVLQLGVSRAVALSFDTGQETEWALVNAIARRSCTTIETRPAVAGKICYSRPPQRDGRREAVN